MDDSNESGGGPLGSSSFFGRFNSAHCDLENMAFSPTTSEFSPFFVPIRRPSLRASNSAVQDFERRNSRRDSHSSYVSSELSKNRRRSSNFSSHQSFDNLQQLMKESDRREDDFSGGLDDQFTQSLPATPYATTPAGSPSGSPKIDRFNRLKKLSTDEYVCSVPWFYSGFISAQTVTEKSSLVCSGEKEAKATESEQLTRRAQEMQSGFSLASQFPVTASNFGRQKRYHFTNRDMNFLAPTSM